MYGYESAMDHSLEYILQHVDQELVFESILGFPVQVDTHYNSPFRSNDEVPGAFFSWHNGLLKFCDFADRKKIRDCVDAIMEYKGLTLQRALKYIHDNYIVGKPAFIPKEPVVFNSTEVAEKLPYEFCYRQFEYKDKLFWYDRYDITRDQLVEDQVFPLNWYRFYSNKRQQWFEIGIRDQGYAIVQWEEGIGKVYRPFADKKKGKWSTNCSANHIGNYNKLPVKGNTLVIAKSYKDWRVLINAGVKHCIWLQNEGMQPDSEILKKLCMNWKHIIIFFDNDATGLRAAQDIKYAMNSVHPSLVTTLSIPLFYEPLGVKDPSDLHYYSKKQKKPLLKEFLTLNKLINGNTDSEYNPSILASASGPIIQSPLSKAS